MKRFAFLSILCVAALAYSALIAPASAQLAVNGGFETGDFSGWTLTEPGVTPPVSHVGSDSSLAHSGNDKAYLGSLPDVTGTLSQAITTSPGQSYNLSFWLASDKTDFVSNSIQVFWNGTSVLSLTDWPPQSGPGVTPNGYVNFTFTNLTPSIGSATLLVFQFLNNDDFFRLDDVSVNLVPETSTSVLALAGFAFLGVAYLRRAKSRRSISP